MEGAWLWAGTTEGGGSELERGRGWGGDKGIGRGLEGEERRVTSGRGGAEWHTLKGKPRRLVFGAHMTDSCPSGSLRAVAAGHQPDSCSANSPVRRSQLPRLCLLWWWIRACEWNWALRTRGWGGPPSRLWRGDGTWGCVVPITRPSAGR